MEPNAASEIIVGVLKHEFRELPERELVKLANHLQRLAIPEPDLRDKGDADSLSLTGLLRRKGRANE